MVRAVTLMAVLTLASVANSQPPSRMTHAQVVAIGSEVLALVRADSAHSIVAHCRPELHFAQYGRGSGSGNVAAGMLQLAFRDAVTFAGAGADGPVGGADGCVNLAHTGNGGLAATVDLLDCVHLHSAALGLGGTFSRADLWALAGTAAVVAAMPSESVASVALRFRSGRQDAADCSTADVGRYPDPEGDLDSVLAVFETRLGLTKREIVALMGAHSIGRAEMLNSGYEGAWLDKSTLQFLVGPRYYGGLLRHRWSKNRSGGTSPSNAPLFQWEHGGIRSHIMLSTDMALVYDIAAAQGAGLSGDVQCGPALSMIARRSSHEGGLAPPCEAQADSASRVTRSIAEEYAQEAMGQALWARDFSLAFTKLVELGFSDGSDLASQQARTLGPASIISIHSLRTDAASALWSSPVAQDDGVPIGRGGSSVFKIVVPAVAGVVVAGVAILAITLLRRRQRQSRVTTVGKGFLIAPVTKAPVLVAWTEPADGGGTLAAAADANAGGAAVSRFAFGTGTAINHEAADVDERPVRLPRAIDTYLGLWSLDGIGDRSRSASRFVASD